jgi:hypothetical protein
MEEDMAVVWYGLLHPMLLGSSSEDRENIKEPFPSVCL